MSDSKFWYDANLSWVSLEVSSSNLNKSRKSDRLKWRSTSSSLSTTQELSAFLWAWRWKIFSSMVPVCRFIKSTELFLLLFALEPSNLRQFFLGRNTYGQQAINKTGFLLSVSPNTSHSLIVVGRIPVWIKHHQPCAKVIQHFLKIILHSKLNALTN